MSWSILNFFCLFDFSLKMPTQFKIFIFSFVKKKCFELCWLQPPWLVGWGSVVLCLIKLGERYSGLKYESMNPYNAKVTFIFLNKSNGMPQVKRGPRKCLTKSTSYLFRSFKTLFYVNTPPCPVMKGWLHGSRKDREDRKH